MPAIPVHRRRSRDASRWRRNCITLLALAGAGCVDGEVRVEAPTESVLRRDGAGVTGADRTAALLLRASGALPQASTPAPPRPIDAALAGRLVHHALDHVRTSALAAADGPSLAGSARIRRAAAAPNAPGDLGGDGTNLDDTLRAESNALAALAGASLPDGVSPVLAPRVRASAVLASPNGPVTSEDLAALRTVAQADRRVDVGALGHAMLAGAWTGAVLGRGRRGSAVGATASDGVLALLVIRQALAIDETLLRDLSFDGEVFAPIDDAMGYDPMAGARWLPARVAFVPHNDLPDAPAEWIAVDRASDLEVAAAVMRGAAELAWLSDPQQPEPMLRELFDDTPLEPPAPTGGPPPDLATWVDDARPILHGATAGCLGCHAPPVINSAFSLATYDDVFVPGLSGVPAVVPGRSSESPLWLVLNGPWLPPNRGFPVPRMPFQRPQLPQADIDTIARWIDDGALREAPPPPPDPRAGLDLARVVFRNVVALHEVRSGPDAGLLDRRSGATRSELAGAGATGRALLALAALATVDGEEPGLRDALARHARAAADRLALADGGVVGEWDLRTRAPSDLAANVEARASLGGGLLAAARVLGDPALRDVGLAVGSRLIDDAWLEDEGLFDASPDDGARLLDSTTLGALLDLLHELQLAGHARAGDVASRLLETVAAVLPFSELDGSGEILGDGIADTDRNGVVEPSANGRAPLLAERWIAGAPAPADLTARITWSRHVLPLFRSRCVGCHVDGAAEGSYRVDTPALAAQAGDSGAPTAIVPGDADASLLFRKLADRAPLVGDQMPLARPPLEPRDLELVRRWIDEGARDR